MERLKFYLFKTGDTGLTPIPPLKDYLSGTQDTIVRDKEAKYFSYTKQDRVTLYREGYGFLREVNVVDGVNVDVRLIIKEKNDRTTEEEYVTISNEGINLFTLDFDDDEQTVDCDLITGGLLELIEKRWSDTYDVMPDVSISGQDIGPMDYKTLLLEPRQILRRSRLFTENGTIVDSPAGPGLTARAIPLQVDYSSEAEITSVVNTIMNSVSGDYADLQFSGATFLLNAKRDTTYTLDGTVTIQVVTPVISKIDLDLVFYDDAGDLKYNGQKINLDSATNPDSGDILTFTFNNYSILVKEGQSLALGTLIDCIIDAQHIVIDVTAFRIQQDTTLPQTTTRTVRLGELCRRVLSRITGETDLFRSSEFSEGGKYYDYLISHGTWIRNVPPIINQGEEDEQETKASVSLEFLWSVFNLPEPMRYKQIDEGMGLKFYVGPEKETQRNDVGVRIGETRNVFQLTQVANVKRKVVGDNYYGKVDIGSNKTGDDYEEVNNLYSICGNAQWNTVNERSDSVYEIRSDVRTGAEDTELQREKQYENNPDIDAARDEDWFLFDCKPSGGTFRLKKWQDVYAVKPQNVYSADTNYNWAFTPARLLLGHSWKISSAFPQAKYINESLRFIDSNCNKTLITQVSGEDPFSEGANIPHSKLQTPTIVPMSVEFDSPVIQEIVEQLRNPENLEKLVQFLTKDGVEYGRLTEVLMGNEGKWQLIEAKLN